jgi:glycolate oxidase
MLNKSVLERLTEIAGRDNVLSDEESLKCYSYDATRYASSPDAVVKPRDTEEISKVVALAWEEAIAVTPRGAGTGLSGGSVPVKAGIVLSTERMNSAPRIHKEDLYVEAEAGLVTEQLHSAVEARGLFYPPDPASQSACTIGGNIGECAGGLRGLKYGTTRNYVLGLELVSPEGKVLRTGARTVKSVAGYDVTRLMVGAEGTLGVVTSAFLKVLPLPPARRVLSCSFPDLEKASEVVSEILGRGLVPSILEVMDEKTVAAVEAHTGEKLGDGVMLLLELDGTRTICEEDATRAREIVEGKFGGRVIADVDGSRREIVWKARRAVLPALTRLSPTVILEDVTVPRSRLPEMAAAIMKVAERYALRIAVFGHAGDGNLHPTFLTDQRRHDELKRVNAGMSEMMRACIDLGGTISGEHGIGLDKMPFLKLELGKAGYDIMRRLKISLDPKGIMNPGKMFYDA